MITNNWFPYYFSKDKNDYVSVNGVHTRCETLTCLDDCQKDNPDYWSNKINNFYIPTPKNIEIAAYGCSFTYGGNMPQEKTWPHLLSLKKNNLIANFSVPAGGIDSIYINLKKSFLDYKIKKIIVLFPNFERKLLRFFINGYYFKYPVSIGTSWTFNDTFCKEYITTKQIKNKIETTKKSLLKDKNNFYSKWLLKKIVKFCENNNINFYFSSWDKGVYEYLLKNYVKNCLPYFNMSWFKERSVSGHHPTELHYSKWVDLINSKIL